MIYTSKQNPLIKSVYLLKDKKYREKQGLYVTEGVKTVNEAVKSGAKIKYVFATENCADKICAQGLEIKLCSQAVFDYMSTETSPQGALAVIELPDTTPKAPCGNAVVLDGVSDPGNMGTIIRSCVASGYTDVYCISTTDPFSPKAVRASMSGIFFVNIYKTDYAGLETALSGYDILTLDMNGQNIFEFVPPKKFALVVGNESNGVSNVLKEKASAVLSIPMNENMESLNAGVSVSIAMYKLKY